MPARHRPAARLRRAGSRSLATSELPIWIAPTGPRRRGPKRVNPPRSKLDPYAPLPISSDVQSLSKYVSGSPAAGPKYVRSHDRMTLAAAIVVEGQHGIRRQVRHKAHERPSGLVVVRVVVRLVDDRVGAERRARETGIAPERRRVGWRRLLLRAGRRALARDLDLESRAAEPVLGIPALDSDDIDAVGISRSVWVRVTGCSSAWSWPSVCSPSTFPSASSTRQPSAYRFGLSYSELSVTSSDQPPSLSPSSTAPRMSGCSASFVSGSMSADALAEAPDGTPASESDEPAPQPPSTKANPRAGPTASATRCGFFRRAFAVRVMSSWCQPIGDQTRWAGTPDRDRATGR